MEKESRYHMTDAERCRANGWIPGDTLEGCSTTGAWARIRLTAVGESIVLARQVERRFREHPWEPTRSLECSWPLDTREWRKVEQGIEVEEAGDVRHKDDVAAGL